MPAGVVGARSPAGSTSRNAAVAPPMAKRLRWHRMAMAVRTGVSGFLDLLGSIRLSA